MVDPGWVTEGSKTRKKHHEKKGRTKRYKIEETSNHLTEILMRNEWNKIIGANATLRAYHRTQAYYCPHSNFCVRYEQIPLHASLRMCMIRIKPLHAYRTRRNNQGSRNRREQSHNNQNRKNRRQQLISSEHVKQSDINQGLTRPNNKP